MRAMGATAAMVAWVVAGCLPDERRGQVEDDASDGQVSDGDASQDVGGEVAEDTGGDGDTDVTSCQDEGDCDDQDPCTVDRCNAATGLCEHLGVAPGRPAQGCVVDADCDDRDPCTSETCLSMEECGVITTMCVSEDIPGCDDCTTGCDDQDPCTLDECAGGLACVHEPQEGCTRECLSGEVVAVGLIRTQPGTWPEPLETVGEVVFDALGRSCDDGPECGCVGWPGLTDGGFELALRGVDETNAGEPWRCESEGCVEAKAKCMPVHLGVRYKLWGRGLQEWELQDVVPAGGGAEPIAPLPAFAGLAVADYCLETLGLALVGSYHGLLDVGGIALEFDAVIQVASDGQGLVLEYGSATCESCNLTLAGGRVPLIVGDGWVEVEILLPSLGGEALQRIRFFSNRNQLIGRYGLLRTGVVPRQGGRVVLTRLP
jgi:hypothetical protein